LVRALTHAVRRGDDAERLGVILLDLVENALAARGGDLQLEEAVGLEEAVVDRVAHRRAVDAHDTAADLELTLVGDRARRDFGDAVHGPSCDSGQPSWTAPIRRNDSYLWYCIREVASSHGAVQLGPAGAAGHIAGLVGGATGRTCERDLPHLIHSPLKRSEERRVGNEHW